MRQRRAGRGFTLIEVMIAVAIIGILVAIAYPSYTSHIRKQRRADAQRVLMDLASRQHQYLLDTRAYATESTIGDLQTKLKFADLPSSVANYYSWVTPVYSASPLGFTLAFTATGEQAKDTSCATLTITSAGAKSPAACW